MKDWILDGGLDELASHLQDEGDIEDMRTLSDLPLGVTVADIEDQIADEEEITTTGALAAILDEEIQDEESGLTGKPYESDETPITEEEAQEVIEEMRRAVSSDGTISLARAVANELGLEVEA